MPSIATTLLWWQIFQRALLSPLPAQPQSRAHFLPAQPKAGLLGTVQMQTAINKLLPFPCSWLCAAADGTASRGAVLSPAAAQSLAWTPESAPSAAQAPGECWGLKGLSDQQVLTAL